MISSISRPFEWQLKQWREILSRHLTSALPHALLISGPEFVGKENFAIALVQRLLCLSSDQGIDQACGQCKGCNLCLAGNHPDLVLIEPEDEGKEIKIKQIRALASFVSKSAHQGGWKVIMINPIDKMGPESKVAVLKILEEPQGQTVFIIVSHEAGRVPPTITSRCQKITFPVPPEKNVLKWLQDGSNDENKLTRALDLSNGKPLLAQHYLSGSVVKQRDEFNAILDNLWFGQISPVEAAKKCHQKKALELMDWYRFRVHSMAKDRCDGALEPEIFLFYDKLNKARHWLIESNPNPKLLWEELFFDWTALSKKLIS